jgi:hypothetical protein
MARTGRPAIPLHRQAHTIAKQEAAVVSFYNFCIEQQLRIMKGISDYAPDTSLYPDEIISAYRESRLGPALHALDYREGISEVWRR